MVVLKPGMESFEEWPNISGKWKLLKLGEVGAHEQQWTLSPPRSVVVPWASYLPLHVLPWQKGMTACLWRGNLYFLKFNISSTIGFFLQWYIVGTHIGPTTPSLYHQITGVFSSISFIVATLQGLGVEKDTAMAKSFYEACRCNSDQFHITAFPETKPPMKLHILAHFCTNIV